MGSLELAVSSNGDVKVISDLARVAGFVLVEIEGQKGSEWDSISPKVEGVPDKDSGGFGDGVALGSRGDFIDEVN